MELLRQENYNESLLLLRKAESLLANPDTLKTSSKLQAITYNNIGCFYKKAGKSQLALQYLQKALEVSKHFPNEYTNLAGTHLNICAIVSQIGDHETGVSHAIKALQLLKKAHDEDGSPNTISTLIIALHNTGVEYEFLGEYQKAEETYKCGLDLAYKHLGKQHQLSHALLKNYTLILNTKESAKPQKTKKMFFEKIPSGKPRSRYSVEPLSPIEKKKLPKIRTTSGRARKSKKQNKSFGFSNKNNDILSPKSPDKIGFPQESNSFKRKFLKTAPESNVIKPQTFLPVNSTKPVSMSKPRHLSALNKEEKTITKIEDRIETLQSQLDEFENKYKELEKFTAKKTERQSVTPSPPLSKLLPAKSVHQSVSPPSNSNHLSAIVIQRFWRGYKTRKDYKHNKRLNAQKKARAAIEELEILKKRAFEDNIYADTIPVRPKTNSPIQPVNPLFSRISKTSQKYKRSQQLEPIPEAKIESKTDRAILIQSHIRRFVNQSKFKRMRSSAIKIQKNIRGHQIRNLFQDILSAAIYIQSFWRGYKVRKDLR